MQVVMQRMTRSRSVYRYSPSVFGKRGIDLLQPLIPPARYHGQLEWNGYFELKQEIYIPVQ
jgi:hypothetical protein